LKKFVSTDYSVFVRDLKRVGYEKRTSKRNVFFNPIYKINDTIFEVEVDGECTSAKKPKSVADFRNLHAARNRILGIWQLDREMKSLEGSLQRIQEKVIFGEISAGQAVAEVLSQPI
jgi:hypothetical protein